jgi:hypothetical protein
MNMNRELETPIQPPLSGTVDDADDVDDEHEEENEAPLRAVSDKTDTRDEFRMDEREEDSDAELNDDVEDDNVAE